MDAAHNLLKKTALFLATALLIAVPGRAQSQLLVSSNTVALNDNQARSITVTTSGTTPVTYTASGVPSWLFASSSNNFTTPDNLSFQLFSTICGTCQATITLTPVGLGNGNPVQISVTYAPGGAGGGSGSLTASPSTLTFSAFSGEGSQQQNVSLSTSTSSVIITNFQSDQPLWLSAAITSGSSTVTPATPATMTVTANAASLSNGTYTGHITITPSVGTATTITVQITVGSGGGGISGTVIANPSALSFSAAAGQIATSQNITLTTNSSSPVSTTGSFDVSWLSGNVISGNLSSISSLSPVVLTITASAAALSNGTYTGHLNITPTSGTATQVTITFTVGSGGGSTGSTIVASPGSLTFSASSGQNAAAQNVTLSTSSTSPLAISGASFDVSWLQGNVISGSLANLTSTSPAVLSVTASAASLTNGTYTGHFTITPSVGSATQVTITFIVGTGGGGGTGSTGTITASQTSFSFAYPSSVLAGAITINTSNPVVSAFNVTVSSQSNWLLFQGSSSGTYNGVSFGTYSVAVNQSVAASLPTGTYTGSLSLVNPQNSNDITTVSLTLSVNGGGGSTGGSTTLSVTPATVNFTASPGSAAQSTNIMVTAPNNATVTLQATSFNGAFFNISSSVCAGTPNATFSCSFTGSQTLTITVNPTILTVDGNYTATLSFQSGGTTASTSVVLSLTSPVTSLTVSPTALAFTATAGGVPQIQDLTVAVPSTAFVQVNLASFNGNFFSVSSGSCNANPSTNPTCSFNGDQTLAVTVNPAVLTSAGTYNGTIQIQSGGVTTNVTVTLTLGSGGGGGGGTTTSIAAPTSLAFYYQTGSSAFVPQQVITVGAVGTFTATESVNTSQQWLNISTVGNSGPGYVIVSVNPSGLSAGATYQGSININSASGSLSIPVSLAVTTGIVVEPTNGDIYFNYQAGSGSVQQSITLLASDGSATPVSLASTTSWITVGSPSGNTTPASFPLTLSPNGLCNGLNVGSLTVTAPNATNNGFTIPVIALVSGSTATGCNGSTGGSTLTVSPASLTFTSQTGSSPATQTLAVTSTSGTSGQAFTYQVTGNIPISVTANGVTVQNGQSLTTPANLTLTVTTTGLAVGSYSGTITLTPSGGTAVSVPVSLTVSAASVSATPTTLTFSFAAGSSAPSPQTVTVSGTSGSAFTATASSSGNWLSVSPASGTVPGTLSVSVNPTGLSANTYTGTITVAGTGGATGSTIINVTLTVTAPLPTITSLGSAASYAGGSLSPGEIVTIFGTSIGPTPGVTLALDPTTGKVATTLGGVQVLVNGIQAPMIYASNTQVSAVVPYEICSVSCGPGTIAQVVVKFLGQSSNGIPTPVASTTTAIFTANASGSGPGAILNANNSVNSPANPAHKGDTVAVYLTGEGLTSPSGVTGKVTTVAATSPITPVPLLPVAVLVNGQPASISFAGEAPGLVSGVMQLNFQIPATVASGNISLVVSIGGVSSQQGVTVSVQ